MTSNIPMNIDQTDIPDAEKGTFIRSQDAQSVILTPGLVFLPSPTGKFPHGRNSCFDMMTV